MTKEVILGPTPFEAEVATGLQNILPLGRTIETENGPRHIFMLNDISYYKNHSPQQSPSEYRIYQHASADGEVEVYKDPEKGMYVAQLTLRDVIEIFRHEMSVGLLSPRVKAPHTHVIKFIKLQNENDGSIYTIDEENSRWSLHISNPEKAREEYQRFKRLASQKSWHTM